MNHVCRYILGLVQIKRECVEFKIHDTIVSIDKVNIERALEELVDVYESRTMGPLRTLRLFHHNLLLTLETGLELISRLQPHLEEGKKAEKEFRDNLRSINHPNVIIDHNR